MIKKIWIVVIGLGLAWSLAGLGAAWRERHRLEAGLAGFARDREQRHAVTARASDALAEVERLAAAELREQQELEAALQARTAASEPKSPDSDTGLILTRDPALRARFERSLRHELNEMYAARFQRWNLSPEKSEALYALLIRDAENELDLRGAAGAHGFDADHPGAADLRRRQFEELLAAEKTLLAPEEYEALQQFQRIEGVRDGVNGLCAIALATEPFGPAQIDQLTQVLAEASRSYRDGGRATWETVDWADVLTRAPAFLSAAQVDDMRNYAHLWQLAANHLPKIFPRGSEGK
jgi:F0F1-type ATP synthase membrane subunit c/vacuolar-type H+-ATPase subunit K